MNDAEKIEYKKSLRVRVWRGLRPRDDGPGRLPQTMVMEGLELLIDEIADLRSELAKLRETLKL